MPTSPPKACNKPRCPNTTHGRYCEQHQAQANKAHNDAREFYKTAGWQRKRKAWLSQQPFCIWTEKDGRPCNRIANTVDHRIPLSKGGADIQSNYQSLCARHHSVKTYHENHGISI